MRLLLVKLRLTDKITYMPGSLANSERCLLFEKIAQRVWRYLIRCHRVNVSFPEVGLTSAVLVDILNFTPLKRSNFEVFAKPGWNEKDYGSDLDIYVETQKGQFVWFALQAKVLKANNRYDTLRDTSDGIMQWDKLLLLEGVVGCKAYYLLFNGRDSFTHAGNDCKGAFTEEQFGCSLAELSTIESLATVQNPANMRFINPTFEDIHPLRAEPWRKLVCCYHDTNKMTLYSLDQVLRACRGYIDLSKRTNGHSGDGDSDGNDTAYDSNSGDDPIGLGSAEAKWSPAIRIIVHTTSLSS